MVHVLVTGATGFVGSQLVTSLNESSFFKVTAAVRRRRTTHEPYVFEVGELNCSTDFSDVLKQVDVVVHTAARVHVMTDNVVDSLTEYRKVNVDATVNLVQQAVAAGVKRFIFISSVKVHGECTLSGESFNYESARRPEDEYSLSKLEAENKLKSLASDSDMEFVIIRPPLIYGVGVGANFGALIRLVKNNIPIPLGALKNKRSLVALDNLISLIITCISHPQAANQTFLVSDDQDVSTTELLKEIAFAFGKKSKLIPVPMSLIQFVASLLGKRAVAQRLCSSLVVDISHTKETLSWKPPVTMEQQLAKIAVSLSQLTPDN